jgi:ketopantoate reductase
MARRQEATMTNKIRITGAAAAGPARVLVLGAGVIGSAHAGRLLQAEHHPVMLARGQRLADLRARGLVLEDAQSNHRTEASAGIAVTSDRTPGSVRFAS